MIKLCIIYKIIINYQLIYTSVSIVKLLCTRNFISTIAYSYKYKYYEYYCNFLFTVLI